MRQAILLTGLLAAFVSQTSTPAQAGLVLSSSGGGPISGFQSTQNGIVGFDFTVGSQDILVTRFGVLDLDSIAPNNGLYSDHLINLWNSTGTTVLGSATVPAGTSADLINGFRFVDLTTPIQLDAGESYVLGAYFPMSGAFAPDIFRFNSVPSMQSIFSSDFTYIQGRIGFGPDFPTIATGNGGYVGPNLEYSVKTAVVPEPSTLLSGLIGAAMLGGYGLRRRSR